jgi:hypothetical protein
LKVPNLIGSNFATRALVVVSLAFALTAAIAAPLMATAQEVPLAVTPPVTATVTSATVESSVTTPPPAPVRAPVAKKLTVRQIIAKVGHVARLSKAQIAGLLWIAKRESNFHPTSVSRSGCHGLFQLSSGMVHGHPWKDPAWNTKRAIKYMKGRYGGVLQAKAFWSRHHWY